MISTEVQRTLVKSPPELWAELSDEESLARHLGELGDVRITRTEPETRIEWEAGDTSGTVLLKASGWGTKVKLSVDRELPQPEPAAAPEPVTAAPEPVTAAPADPPPAPAASASVPAPHVATAVEPLAEETPPETASPREPEPPCEPEPPDEPQPPYEPAAESAPPATPQADASEQQPAAEPKAGSMGPAEPLRIERRGFFARLFSRGRRQAADAYDADTGVEPAAREDADVTAATMEARPEQAVEELATPSAPSTEAPEAYEPVELPSTATFAAVTSAIAPDGCAAADPFGAPAVSSLQPQPADLAAELRAAEETAAAQVAAVLTAVLDSLGSAHHRPFSRS